MVIAFSCLENKIKTRPIHPSSELGSNQAVVTAHVLNFGLKMAGVPGSWI